MIMLTGKNRVDMNQYDHIWYVTTTCPNMRVGCEHHPELAASYKLHVGISSGRITEEEFYTKYVKEISSPPKLNYLLDVVRRSEAGEWFQFIFYEDSKEDGERKYMYEILKKYTDNVCIE